MDLQIFGHRGYAARRIENTISAFELAAETSGIAGVELDVQIAWDGEVVVIHDGDLQRLADDPRRIVEVSSGELATITLHANDRDGTELTIVGVPTLNTVIDTLPPWMKIDIELKSYDDTPRDLPEQVARLLADRARSERGEPDRARSHRSLAERVIVSSFDPRLIRRFRREVRKLESELAAPISTAVIYSEDREVPRFLRTGLGVSLTGSEIAKPSWRTALSVSRGGRPHPTHPTHQLHRRDRLRRPHRPTGSTRAPQYVWTVNDRDVLLRLMARNVAGVIGDDPGELVSWATAIAGQSAEPDGGRQPERRSE